MILTKKYAKLAILPTGKTVLPISGRIKAVSKTSLIIGYFGRSGVYDWEPIYDFDCYKLWSFLCAYYYDFSAENGDIKYWDFGSDTEELLDEIFNAEYEFIYWYDNKSRWEELYPYNYFGGSAAEEGTYYCAEKDAYIYDDQPYGYRFKPITSTGELW